MNFIPLPLCDQESRLRTIETRKCEMHINSDVHKYTRRYDNYAQVTIHLRGAVKI